jgi:hypothetical protein
LAWALDDTQLYYGRVRVEIVDVATGDAIAEWKLDHVAAADLRAKIESDLDAQGADVFAAGWSLPHRH